MNPRIFVSAGEPSGDLHAARVVRALRVRFPGATIDAFAGPAVAAAGARVLFPMERYTVMGIAEIVHKIPAHAQLLFELRRRFRRGDYDLVLMLDYPGFHLRLGTAARRAGVKVLYYIAPQLWAWRPERAARVRAAADRLAVIFPFEVPFFASLGITADYVGHPLLDRQPWPSRVEARTALGLAHADRMLAVFPGSRSQEIKRLWPPFRDAAAALMVAGACDRVEVAALGGQRYPGGEGMTMRTGDSLTVLAAADAVLAKSGTTTLEAALSDVPMVVAYRVHRLTALLVRRLIRVPWISPVNLVADRQVVPELLQAEVTAEALARAARPLLEAGSHEARGQREGLELVRRRLGAAGAADRVAAMVGELL